MCANPAHLHHNPNARNIIIRTYATVYVALAGIELKYLVNRISEDTQGYYVSNIYGIDRDSILFKLHHPDKADIMLVLSTAGVWITSVRIQQIAENRLVRRLRDTLLRLRLEKVEQPGLERLTYLTFGGFDQRFVLVGEFFGDGNVILCSDTGKVLALQHSIDVRHRSLAVGREYAAPPSSGRSALHMDISGYMEIKESAMTCARWLGRTLGLPKRYAEGIPRSAGIDPKTRGDSMDDAQVRALQEAAGRIIHDVIYGNHSPTIIREGGAEAAPVRLGYDNAEDVQDFMAGLDSVFTQNILERGREALSGQSVDQTAKLEGVLAEQKKAIQTVKSRAEAIGRVADSMYSMLSSGILRLDTEGAAAALSGNGAVLVREKGVPTLAILDEKIKINLDAPLQSTASVLYGESKRQAAAIPSIETMISKTQRKLEKAARAVRVQQGSVAAAEVRRRNWFERYRWFYTSDGTLAVGGRDAPSNSAVIRKHMEQNDRVFHAQVFGSPFFVLKGGGGDGTALEETAQATVCFSRVWREAMHGSTAYWVNPDQVKKSAPSGQYLPKGSFTIEGKRNFVQIPGLKLGVGLMEREDDILLVCGPPAAITRHASSYVMIEPGGSDASAAAKKVRGEFLDMRAGGADMYTIDDYVRVLPPGKSRITLRSDGA